MSVGSEQDRDRQRREEQALEEIRVLFARYRRFARHGMVAERDRPVERRAAQQAKRELARH
jgi:hypothetical protein